MTTPNPDDDTLRDPRFDAAWRAASNEAPPPALDASIRAAARREVGAGPQREVTRVPEATRPERWWWPLAAAATIGAIAIGVLQTAPQERDATKAVVSDLPADGGTVGRVANDARKEIARAIVAPPAAEPRAPAPAAEPTGSARQAQPAAKPATSGPAPPRATQPFPGGTPASAPAPAVEAKTDELAKRETRVNATGVAEPAPPAPAPKVGAMDSAGRMESATTPPASTQVAPAFAPTPPAAPPAAAAMAPPAPAPQAAGAISAPPDGRARTDAAAFPTAPPAELQRAAETPLSERQLASAKARPEQRPDPALDAKMKDRARLPVPEWIALIRKLRDEGRTDDAALELKAFRALHPDAEALLPADLRDWPPGRR